MLLIPIAFIAAIVTLLVILRRERQQRAAGVDLRRPPYVYMALGFFAFVGVYLVIGALAASTPK